jgi:hypothetical protein
MMMYHPTKGMKIPIYIMMKTSETKIHLLLTLLAKRILRRRILPKILTPLVLLTTTKSILIPTILVPITTAHYQKTLS